MHRIGFSLFTFLLLLLSACANSGMKTPAFCSDLQLRYQMRQELELERVQLQRKRDAFSARIEFLKNNSVVARADQLAALQVAIRSHEVDMAENQKRLQRLSAEQSRCESLD